MSVFKPRYKDKISNADFDGVKKYQNTYKTHRSINRFIDILFFKLTDDKNMKKISTYQSIWLPTVWLA